ncbi:MAG: GntR family transcriptional regulator [Devosia sp.]|nr:GntR family transcriptional regulator [Devosia sp.]
MSVATRMNQAGNADGRKPTLAGRVSLELRRAILNGQLQPGEKINLDRMREDFDVSVSPIREAVSRLVGRLVEFEDQRGFRVAPISLENLRCRASTP